MLVEIIEKHGFFYSISRDLTYYLLHKNDLELFEPDYGVAMKFNEYLKLKNIYPDLFIDNSDTDKAILCPLFVDNDNAIDIHLFINSSEKKHNKNFNLLVRNNYSYINDNKKYFSFSKRFNAWFYHIFWFWTKTQSLKYLASLLFENEYTTYSYIFPQMNSKLDSLYKNISFKTNTINYENKELKYSWEFKEKAKV